MKLKFISKPKEDLCAENKSVSFLLDETEMSSVYGGASCGIYVNCGQSNKNHCSPYDCWIRTSCTSRKSWVVEEMANE
jgi:hypothetical protein